MLGVGLVAGGIRDSVAFSTIKIWMDRQTGGRIYVRIYVLLAHGLWNQTKLGSGLPLPPTGNMSTGTVLKLPMPVSSPVRQRQPSEIPYSDLEDYTV